VAVQSRQRRAHGQMMMIMREPPLVTTRPGRRQTDSRRAPKQRSRTLLSMVAVLSCLAFGVGADHMRKCIAIETR
jgi:hypothetical protein